MMGIQEVWAIAGPSGCGKSTLSFNLQEHFDGQISLLQLDDYFHPKDRVPQLNGFINWDHPEALDFDKYRLDIKKLLSGEPITIMTKNKTVNPDYEKTRVKVPMTIEPRNILILEGYLVLHDPSIRDSITKSIYLNLPSEIRNKRRDKLALLGYEGYHEAVLEPMTREFVEPTRVFATSVIEVGQLTPQEVMLQAIEILTRGDRSDAR